MMFIVTNEHKINVNSSTHVGLQDVNTDAGYLKISLHKVKGSLYTKYILWLTSYQIFISSFSTSMFNICIY